MRSRSQLAIELANQTRTPKKARGGRLKANSRKANSTIDSLLQDMNAFVESGTTVDQIVNEDDHDSLNEETQSQKRKADSVPQSGKRIRGKTMEETGPTSVARKSKERPRKTIEEADPTGVARKPKGRPRKTIEEADPTGVAPKTKGRPRKT